MRKLLDIISVFKEYVVLGICAALSVGLMTLNDNAQVRTIRSLTVISIGFLQEAFGFIPNYFDLKHDNKLLRERNVSLANEVSLLRESRLENLRLRKLLGLKELSQYSYVTGNVVGKNLQLLRNTVTLDCGENQGIRVNMPVVTDEGLVGRIVAVSSSYAIGQLLLNRDARVSAKVQRARVDGIVTWEGGPYLSMKNVARTLDVQPGDIVITSEYSSLFPPGIKIGVVNNTHQTPGALFQSIDLEPAVDFTRLEEVFVITRIPDSSRIVLEQRVRR